MSLRLAPAYERMHSHAAVRTGGRARGVTISSGVPPKTRPEGPSVEVSDGFPEYT